MARTLEQVIRDALAEYQMRIATLVVENETLRDRIAELEKKFVEAGEVKKEVKD